MSTSTYTKHISMNCIMSNLIRFLAKLACCSLPIVILDLKTKDILPHLLTYLILEVLYRKEAVLR